MNPLALKLTGHAFEVIGAFGFGYELLRGYPQRNRREIAQVQLDNMLAFLKTVKMKIDQLPEPYTAADKEAQKRELDNEWNPKAEALRVQIEKRGRGHETVSFYFGLFGAAFLIVGFLLQLIAELMEA